MPTKRDACMKLGRGLQRPFESLAGASATPLSSPTAAPPPTMLTRFSCLLAVLPVSMAAEFDKCLRANALWAGFDQARFRALCSFQACD